MGVEPAASHRRGPRPITLSLPRFGATIALVAAVGAGASCSTSTAKPSTSIPAGVSTVGSGQGPSASARTALVAYLDAIVARDWHVAHDLACADLADQETAGQLKLELKGSTDRAGALQSFAISRERPGTGAAKGSAEIDYELVFAKGTAKITARLETEGRSWRVCSFANHGGNGVFEGNGSA